MQQREIKKGDAASGQPRFLIVDDSAFARKNMAFVVDIVGGVVAGEAANGREAIEQYRELKPDMVLMDISMPEMEGLEALAKIKDLDKDARVIIISSLGYQDQVKKALSLGALHFIAKPYDIKKAADIIKFSLKGIKQP